MLFTTYKADQGQTFVDVIPVFGADTKQLYKDAGGTCHRSDLVDMVIEIAEILEPENKLPFLKAITAALDDWENLFPALKSACSAGGTAFDLYLDQYR